MPDGNISTAIATDLTRANSSTNVRMLSGGQMRALWDAFKTAEANYREGDEATRAAYEKAQAAIADAHTIDLAGIAIKLKAGNATYGCRFVASVVEDIELAAAAGDLLIPGH